MSAVPNGEPLDQLRSVFEPPCNVVPHAPIASLTPLIMRHFERRSGAERIVATLRRDLEREPPRETRHTPNARTTDRPLNP